jgi:uncharacterized membrane protein YphA (DoxX/SURF4 family)
MEVNKCLHDDRVERRNIKMNREELMRINWILLGLTMLVAGLLKAFVTGADVIEGMLAGFGIPAAGVMAWVLIIGEAGSGAAILARWNLKKVVWIPFIILVVAAFTAHWANWTNMLVHLTLATNYLLLGMKK